MAKYTQVFVKIVQDAKAIAVTRKHQFMLPVHIMKAMFANKIQDDTVVFDALNAANVNFTELNSELDNELGEISSVEGGKDTKIEYGQLKNQEIQDFFAEIKNQKNVLGDDYIAPDEALLAILTDKDAAFTKFMKKTYKINYDSAKDLLLKQRNGEKVIAPNAVRGSSVLDKYGVDLVAEAQRGKIDPIIGREMETRKVIQVLLRKKKNNPLLLANPGVGKTAIVEGLAQKIAKGDVPDTLKGVKLYSLDLTALTAGASVRGAFEGRIEAVLKEVERSEGRILLFIDEVHNIVGAGGSKGHGDASNILKPALARGKLHLIAATTIMEFKKYIEGDGALTRRFASINVDEPTTTQAVAILRGLRPRFESYYGVTYHDDALIEAVKMSQRYIPDRYLPDKAIELIDSAGSTVKLDTTSTPAALDSDQKELIAAETAQASLMREDSEKDSRELHELKNKITVLKNRIQVETNNWEQAKKVLQNIKQLRSQLHEDLNKLNALSDDNSQKAPLIENIDKLKSDINNQRKNLNGINDSVTAAVIDDIVAEQTGIDVKQLQESEKTRLLHMPQLLHKMVVGQNEAVQQVSDAIKRSRTGLSSPNRPIGSFLFMGPSGTGKETPNTDPILIYKDNHEQWTTVGQLKLGNYVYGRKGQTEKVVGIYPHPQEKAYKVTLKDGRTQITGADHLWSVRTISMVKHNSKNWKVLSTKQMLKHGLTNNSGQYVYQIPMNNSIPMNYRKHEVDPYIIGVLLGNDCCTLKPLTISSNDAFVVKKINGLLNAQEAVKSKDNYNWNFKLKHSSGKRLYIYTGDVIGRYSEIYNKRNFEKRIPAEYKFGTEEQRLSLLQGLFDTDGSVQTDNVYTYVTYSSTSLQLIKDIQEVLYSLGIGSTYSEYKHKKSEYNTHDKIEYTLCVSAPNKVKRQLFTLPRKLNCIPEDELNPDHLTHYDTVTITNIEELPDKIDMTCIYVDDPEHLYLVGKNYIVTHNTELSKSIAKALFGDEQAMIRIDMSEYQSKASITRLIGSPPGYVGYEEAGQLTEKVRLHPYSVVLFDELEKAHPDVLNILLQILDDGRVTDGKGRTINFKNTIIIATSNLGADQILATWKDPKKPLNETTKSVVMSTLYHHFRPEFINRWDHITIFKPLDYDAQKEIAQIYLQKLHDRLYQNSGINLKITERAVDFIAVDSYDKKLGARPLRRYIQDHLEAQIADAILEDKYKYGDTMYVIRRKGKNGYGKPIHKLFLGTLDQEDDDPIRVTANPPE